MSEETQEKTQEETHPIGCETTCPECLGSGTVFDGEDYKKCPKCKGDGMI